MDIVTDVSFGEWLKRRRTGLGLTQEQLAQQIHCSTSALRKFESEQRHPSAEVVESLAEIFHIPPEERTSFLRFARGDWQAISGEKFNEMPWRAPRDVLRSNLPALTTSFIGREKEIAEIIDLTRKNRIVTLTGVGGIGKTRLAIQTASSLLSDFPDGVWLVELAPLSEGGLVSQAVVSAFGLLGQSNQPPAVLLTEFLKTKTSLLILDNCEHLIAACAQLAESLLHACSGLRILATSREALGIAGEISYLVPPLRTPDPLPELQVPISQFDAVQLFIERASAALPGFAATKDNASAIAQVCNRLDGIPLALELAAARVKLLRVEEIAARLDDRFRLFTGGARTALPRHQTLRAMIDWSHELLTNPERILLRRLSVFAGGWTLEAAEHMCVSMEDEFLWGQILDLLTSLVNKSLILAERKQGRETRYQMLETIRQYAHEKLQETEGDEHIRGRHLEHFAKLVEQAEPELYRSNQAFWFNRLDDERDNFRLALEWALDADVEAGLQIISIPWRFWQRHDYREWGDWLHQFLDRYPQSDPLRAQALAVSSACFYVQGMMSEARKLAEEALQLARALSDPHNEALSLLFLGRSIAFPGDYEEGIPILEQSRDLYQALGDKIGQALAIGWMAVDHNDLEHAKSLLSESLKLHRELGNLSGVAYCLVFLGYYAIFGRDFSSPGPWLEEARTLYHELGDLPNEADALETLGLLAERQGKYEQAHTCFEQAIVLYEKAGGSLSSSWTWVRKGHACLRQGDLARAREIFDRTIQEFQKNGQFIGIVYTIEGLASLNVHQGGLERAVRLFAWANSMREQFDNQRPPVEQADVERDLAMIRDRLALAAFAKLSEEGRAMTVEQAITMALERVEE